MALLLIALSTVGAGLALRRQIVTALGGLIEWEARAVGVS